MVEQDKDLTIKPKYPDFLENEKVSRLIEEVSGVIREAQSSNDNNRHLTQALEAIDDVLAMYGISRKRGDTDRRSNKAIFDLESKNIIYQSDECTPRGIYDIYHECLYGLLLIETAKQPIDQRMEYYMQNLKSVLHADAAVFQGFDPDLMAREFRPTSQDRAKKYVQYVSAKKVIKVWSESVSIQFQPILIQKLERLRLKLHDAKVY